MRAPIIKDPMINLAYLWKDTQEAGNTAFSGEEKGQLSPVGGTLVFLCLILLYFLN